MKIFLFAASIICIASIGFAQTPRIDTLIVGSEGTDLLLLGSFGVIQGRVTVESTVLAIIHWSSDSIICILQQPVAGKVSVITDVNQSNARILEHMMFTLAHHWDYSPIHYYPFTSAHDIGAFYDTLSFCFDATSIPRDRFNIPSYKSRGAWQYDADCYFGYNYYVDSLNGVNGPCGHYLAKASGTNGSEGYFEIMNGYAGLSVILDAHYGYSASHCQWDSIAVSHTTKSDSGVGGLYRNTTFGFKISNTSLTNRTPISIDKGIAGDDARTFFFDWENGHSYGVGQEEITSYSILYPFPQQSNAVATKADRPPISFYPNPANYAAYIQSPLDIRNIEVFNISGVCQVSNITFSPSGWLVNTTALVNGVYEVACTTNDSVILCKLVVSH
jgi:hypothetical protein